jgi:CRISPR-associated endonuclease/helicase Cas3
LAKRLSEHDQALCIVNRRRDCRALWEALKSITTEVPVHLSALMCGEHRSGVIRMIKAALVRGENIRVISTQLIEAGVDIDFPVVYRAMTGLDGIAQAAGRCNREGRLQGKLGETVVFNPPEGSPPGLLRKREQAGAEVLRNLPYADRLMSPEGFDMYFRCLYRDVNDFGWDSFKRYFTKDVGSGQFQFRSAARWFKLIDEAGMKSIIVHYVSEGFSSLGLLDEVRRLGPSRARMRALQRATVSVPERVWSLLRDQGSIEELEGPEGRMGLWAQRVPDLYDPVFGLKMEGPELSGQEFIC